MLIKQAKAENWEPALLILVLVLIPPHYEINDHLMRSDKSDKTLRSGLWYKLIPVSIKHKMHTVPQILIHDSIKFLN